MQVGKADHCKLMYHLQLNRVRHKNCNMINDRKYPSNVFINTNHSTHWLQQQSPADTNKNKTWQKIWRPQTTCFGWSFTNTSINKLSQSKSKSKSQIYTANLKTKTNWFKLKSDTLIQIKNLKFCFKMLFWIVT